MKDMAIGSSAPLVGLTFFTPHDVPPSDAAAADLSTVSRLVADSVLHRWGAKLVFNSRGRPVTTHPLVDVSITHSRGVGVVTVSCGALVGVDLEGGTWSSDPGFERRVCTRREASWAVGADPQRCKFLWTRKEACLKLLGLGVASSIRPASIDVLDPVVQPGLSGSPVFLRSWIQGETILSLASTAEHLSLEAVCWIRPQDTLPPTGHGPARRLK